MNQKKQADPDRGARERIITAAIGLFAQVPVDMTTIKAVAREADVKQPLLMYHFKTKDQLYHTVLSLALDQMEILFDRHFKTFTTRESFTSEEAGRMLADIIGTLIDNIHPLRTKEGNSLRIILFEIQYPSGYFQETYERFLSRFYVMVAGLIMTVNPTFDLETAVFQWMQIFGLITSHHTEQEVVRRFIGFKGRSSTEREKLKELVVRNAFLLLKVPPPENRDFAEK